MARGKTSTLSITIAGDAKGFKKATGEAGAASDTLGTKARSLAGSLGGIFASGALIAGAKKVIDTTRTVGGELLTLQRLTGGDANFASGLYVAAQQSGIAIDKLSTGISTLASKVQKGGLDKWGIEAKDAAGNARPFEEILTDIRERYQELEGFDKTGFARDLFGRGGGDIMKLLSKTNEEMAKFQEDAKNLGFDLNADDIKAATDAQRDFQLALTGMQVTIGKELLPTVTQFTSAIAKDMPAIADVIGTVAGAFASLPGPLKAVVGLSIALNGPLRLIGGLFGPIMTGIRGIAGARAFDGLRLGLMGVTDASGGASNAVGGFLRSAATSPGVLAGAAVGVGLMVTAFMKMKQEAAEAKANIDGVVSAANQGGKTIEEAFRNQLATTLAGAEGGFKNSYGKSIQETLDRLGVSASEFFQILTGGGQPLEDLLNDVNGLVGGPNEGLNAFSGTAAEAGIGINNLRDAWVGSARQIEDLEGLQEDLNTTTDDGTAATYRSVDATKAATDAVAARNSQLRSILSAQEAQQSAEEKYRDAVIEVAEANEAARGNSEEMVDARQGEADAAEAAADAVESLREAEQGVADAKDRVGDARQDVTEAIADYWENLEKAREAVDDLRMAEQDAALSAIEAADKAADARRQNTDPIEQMRLDFEEQRAEQERLDAIKERQEAEAEAANMAAAGPDGDQGVIDAKQSLADAEDGVADAVKRVRDAREGLSDAHRRQSEAAERTAEVEEAVAQRVVDATAAEQEAKRDLVEAQAAVIEQTDGLSASVRFLQEQLLALYPEGSPQRADIEALVRDLGYVLSGGIGPGGSYATPDAADRGYPAPAAGDIPQDESRDPVRGRRGGVTINYSPTWNGSAAHERRLIRQHDGDLLDKAARRFR